MKVVKKPSDMSPKVKTIGKRTSKPHILYKPRKKNNVGKIDGAGTIEDIILT